MKPKYWRVVGAVAVCSLELLACSSDFSDCGESRSCAAGAGAAAEASGQGGAAGEVEVAEHPPAEGGNAGGGDPEVAEGGQGGDPAAPEVEPALLGPCSVKGALACVGHASPDRLSCDGASWQANTSCGAGKLCDSSNGQCVPVIKECEGAEPGTPVCRGEVPLTCGSDLVSAVEGKACEGLCKNGVCQAPSCGDEKRQTGEDCDDAALTASGACVACKTARCGDKAVFAGPGPEHEQCDDGNTVPGDGCSATCQTEVKSLALGAGVTCALSWTGAVKCWGRNAEGALGLGDVLDRGTTPSGTPSNLPAIDLGKDRFATAIATNGSVVCAVLDNGDLKCWGSSADGLLGTGDFLDRGDDLGASGLGEMGDKLLPIALGGGHKATAVSVGTREVCAVLDTGTLKCWGSGQHGQLGQESLTDYIVPPAAPVKLDKVVTQVSAGWYDTACALMGNVTKCWGDLNRIPAPLNVNLGPSGTDGLGDDPDEMTSLLALDFGPGRSAKSIVLGGIGCAVLNDAKSKDSNLKCWGSSYSGNAGQAEGGVFGMTPEALAALGTVDLGKDRQVESVAVGYLHTCAVLVGGAVKCWGFNRNGQLGLGSTDSKGLIAGDMGDNLPALDFGGLKAKHVYAGLAHTCAILEDGSVRCWGANDSGELGLGHTNSRGDTGGKLSADTRVDLAF